MDNFTPNPLPPSIPVSLPQSQFPGQGEALHAGDELPAGTPELEILDELTLSPRTATLDAILQYSRKLQADMVP